MMKITAAIKKTGHSLISWEWTKKLLHWLIISAGTMAECIFLIASLWVSINANVHQFVLLFLDETTTRHITELATTAYVALPECIVGLAVVTTLSHIRMVMYSKDYRAVIWSVLFGLPTVVFLVLSLITLGCSVANTTFEMPTSLVVVRALAGYMFAFTSLLYTQIGEPQEKDRLAKKDAMLAELGREKDKVIADLGADLEKKTTEWFQHNEKSLAELGREKDRLIADLTRQNQSLQGKLENHTREIEQQNALLTEYKTVQRQLIEAASRAEESALEAYSEECLRWLKTADKSVSVEDINRFTGHSKRKIAGAITAGKLRTTPRNPDLILLSSLTEWLKDNAPSTSKDQDSGPMLRVVHE